jgi:hypothetical protein
MIVYRYIVVLFIFLNAFVVSAQYDYSGDYYRATFHIKYDYKLEYGKEQYDPISFGDLVTHLPAEYLELNTLLEIRKKLPDMTENYGGRLDSVIQSTDLRIQTVKDTIMKRRLFPSYEIRHYFSTRDSLNNLTLTGHDVLLSHNYKLVRMKTYVSTPVSKSDLEWFKYWQEGYPLFNLSDEKGNAKASASLYRELDSTLLYSTAREENLHNAITLIKEVRKEGVFDPMVIARAVIEDYYQRKGLSELNPLVEVSKVFAEDQIVDQSTQFVYVKLQGQSAENPFVYHKFSFNPVFGIVQFTQQSTEAAVFFGN